MHTKPDESTCLCAPLYNSKFLTSTAVSREDYARLISADYHKLIDGKSGEEKALALKEV